MTKKEMHEAMDRAVHSEFPFIQASVVAEEYAREFAVSELTKLTTEKNFASKYNGEYVLTKYIYQAITNLKKKD